MWCLTQTYLDINSYYVSWIQSQSFLLDINVDHLWRASFDYHHWHIGVCEAYHNSLIQLGQDVHVGMNKVIVLTNALTIVR